VVSGAVYGTDIQNQSLIGDNHLFIELMKDLKQSEIEAISQQLILDYDNIFMKDDRIEENGIGDEIKYDFWKYMLVFVVLVLLILIGFVVVV